MNSQSVPVTDPFKLVGEYTPNAPKTLPTITAAPEHSKVSAAEAPKKPRTRKPKAAKPAEPTLTPDELEMIANARKLPDTKRSALKNFVRGLAHIEEHPTEETPAVTLDPEPEPTPAPEPADDETLPDWKRERMEREEFEEAYSYKDGYYMPHGATTDTMYDKPYHNVVRHGDIHKAWGVWGRLIATHQVPLPNMNDDSWSDNLQCTLDVIAETLAELDY